MVIIIVLLPVLLYIGVVRGELEWPYFLGCIGPAGKSRGLIVPMECSWLWYFGSIALMDMVPVL